MKVRQRLGQLIKLIELFPINELRRRFQDGKEQVGQGNAAYKGR